jgi:YesN/AraC family two-component response regulator
LKPDSRYLPGVLVVEDEVRVRSFLRAALEQTVRVVEAEDGERALAILQTQPYGPIDLALVDYLLPKCSGIEVLQLTRQRWPWIPVVILTGYGSEDLAVQALRAGASDYIKKPIALDALMKAVAVLKTVGAKGEPSSATTCNDRSAQARVTHPDIRRALVFIGDHFADVITLADVAREARLSRFHFCRLFHYETGTPFHEYLRDLRVSRAKALLADRYLTVSEVAYSVGFNDLSHFDRTFRKRVGRSPTQYRASLQCA